ncbi:CUB domain-containing protein [Subsaxibacter sp. CAU 1640]|uniref:CUB domain-containing protein n=1 Tax=Subsaxibacter sp. CAU 1640 TaxID=2933271 RepID=UPI0020030C73|nr:CUB domain-containing protein [Subsaxibacter sp. CAU 1640]MCK7590586.1 CUB domain-containing protein [Subsaxibacter sp. CAU 1640]
MKNNKLLKLLMVCAIIWSCSQDSLDSPNSENDNTRLAAGQYDNSYLGVYKGLFSTNDGLIRGTVTVSLMPGSEGEAQIDLSSGEQILLKSRPAKLTMDQKVSQLQFSSEGLSSIHSTFEFSVDGDGTNPLVNNTNFDTRASDILIAKNTQRLPLMPITGTYACTDCAVNGQGFPNSNRTWNIMSIGAGEGQNFMVQVFYGGRIYTSAAENNTQSNCFSSGGFTTCDVAGSIRVLGHDVTWSGTHEYTTYANTTSCSEVSGTWSAPTYGPGVTGTFQSDSDCSNVGLLNDTCASALPIGVGDSVLVSTTDASSVDAPASCVVDLDTAPGVWYTFVGDGFPVLITTEGDDVDTKIGLFTGSCGALDCENGDDNGGLGNNPLIPLNTVLNEIYYIYVTANDGETGDFVLSLIPPTSMTYATCDESIQDHAGDGDYEGFRRDVYVIDAGEGNTVNVNFSEFDTEEGYDFVRIYDGPNTDSLVITMSVEGTPSMPEGFSGTGNGPFSLLGDNVVSTGRYMTLTFYSDPNVVGSGFTGDITCMAGRQAMGMQQTSLTFQPAEHTMPVKN